MIVLLVCSGASGVPDNLVSRKIVEARLGQYGGDNARREATLRQMLADAGCDGKHLSEESVPDSTLPNVICLLPGRSKRLIIVGAHFDRVPEGDGVVDNWSGASLLPSLYEAIKKESHKHTFIFIGFTDEERGEVGSRFYAKQMTEERIAATDAMVNMDALGLARTQIWDGHSDQTLSKGLAFVAKRLNLRVTNTKVEHVSTDADRFAERRIPCITVHSITEETWSAHILHTSKDKLSVVRFDDYYETYCLLAAYLDFLDKSIPEHGLTPRRRVLPQHKVASSGF
jgi:Zn-dependent M28 family amino/carboxypeptidase